MVILFHGPISKVEFWQIPNKFNFIYFSCSICNVDILSTYNFICVSHLPFIHIFSVFCNLLSNPAMRRYVLCRGYLIVSGSFCHLVKLPFTEQMS